MLLLGGATKYQFIIALRGAEFMEVKLVLIGLRGELTAIGLVVARVEKAFIS